MLGVVCALVVWAAVWAQEGTAAPAYSYAVNGEAGWPELTFALKRVDLWPTLPDGKQPRNDLFVVLIGDLISNERSSCLFKRNYELTIGNEVFKTPESNAVNTLREVYEDLDDPMSALGVCVQKNEVKQIFLWFDISEADGQIVLKLDGAGEIEIADEFERVITESGWDGFPTATPAPTRTATRTPTATPLPTNTMTATVTLPVLPASSTSDEQVYVQAVLTHFGDMSTAVPAIATLLQTPDLFDEQWRLDLAIQMAVLVVVDQRASALQPPTRLAAFHEDLLLATGTCAAFANSLADGLDNFDADLLQVASVQVVSCAELSTAAFEVLQDATGIDTTVAPTAVASGAVANRNANLRGGPGTEFEIVGGVATGDTLEVVGRNADGSWYQLADGNWIAAFLVEGVEASIPVAPAPEAESRTGETALVSEDEASSEAGNDAPPTAAPTNTPVPAPVASGGALEIVSVHKGDEYVDIRNTSGAAVELGGWVLRSEKGSQDCALGGVIEAGATLRVWAMAEDAGRGGFNCGFDGNIWNNNDPDPAVLIGPDGAEVDRV